MSYDVPVWLLDVDGVINASKPGWGAAPFRGTVRAGGIDWKLRWAPVLINRIRDLCLSGAVEVRWATTWCDDAELLEQLWHLPPLARAFTIGPTDDLRAVASSKNRAARQVLAEGRRLIWTDDTEVPATWEPVYAQFAGPRSLLIRPQGRCGLQPEDMDHIEAFCHSTKGDI